MIFQLLDQLVRAASTLAAEQVASMVSLLIPCAAWKRETAKSNQQDLTAFWKILTESSVSTKLMPRLVLWNRT